MSHNPRSESGQSEPYDGPLMAHPYVGKAVGYVAMGAGGLDVLYASSQVAGDLTSASEPETLALGGAGLVLLMAGDWVRQQYSE